MILLFGKNHMLTVTFPKTLANFRAMIRDEQDVTDLLLMVATYKRTAASSN
jgi:hypothetical protein